MWLSSLKSTLHLAYAIAINIAKQHEATKTTPSHHTFIHIFFYLIEMHVCIQEFFLTFLLCPFLSKKIKKTFHFETQG